MTLFKCSHGISNASPFVELEHTAFGSNSHCTLPWVGRIRSTLHVHALRSILILCCSPRLCFHCGRFISVSSTNICHETVVVIMRATYSTLVWSFSLHLVWSFTPYWVRSEDYKAFDMQFAAPIFLLLSFEFRYSAGRLFSKHRLVVRREWISEMTM